MTNIDDAFTLSPHPFEPADCDQFAIRRRPSFAVIVPAEIICGIVTVRRKAAGSEATTMDAQIHAVHRNSGSLSLNRIDDTLDRLQLGKMVSTPDASQRVLKSRHLDSAGSQELLSIAFPGTL